MRGVSRQGGRNCDPRKHRVVPCVVHARKSKTDWRGMTQTRMNQHGAHRRGRRAKEGRGRAVLPARQKGIRRSIQIGVAAAGHDGHCRGTGLRGQIEERVDAKADRARVRAARGDDGGCQCVDETETCKWEGMKWRESRKNSKRLSQRVVLCALIHGKSAARTMPKHSMLRRAM